MVLNLCVRVRQEEASEKDLSQHSKNIHCLKKGEVNLPEDLFSRVDPHWTAELVIFDRPEALRV